jgi:hypothetical protein
MRFKMALCDETERRESMDKRPWDFFPQLTRERLVAIAQILQDVRHRTLELYLPDEGDGAWSLGCRIYERSINTIERYSNKFPWLSFDRRNLYFLMMIEGFPIRFFKGDVRITNKRLLQLHEPEIQVQTELFKGLTSIWRIIITTYYDGEVAQIVLAKFADSQSKDPNYIWEIPLGEKRLPIPDEKGIIRDGVNLNKPIVSPKPETARFENKKEYIKKEDQIKDNNEE